MALDEGRSKKLQALLGALPPNMRATLQRMIAEARKAGMNDPTFDLLAEFLGEPVENAATEAPIADALSVFKQALTPFLIDEMLSRKVAGRIFVETLEPIWAWLSSDIAKSIVATFDEQRTSTNPPRPEAFLASVARAMSDIIAKARANSDERRRMSGQVGGERNFEEFEDIAVILARSKELSRFNELISEVDASNEAALTTMLSRIIVDLGRLDQRLPCHVGILTLAKLGSLSKLARIAVACAGTEDIKVIATSPFASFIEISLAETERSATRVMAGLKQLKSDGTLAPSLREFAMSSRNLRAILNLDQTNHEWSKRLTEMRTRLSESISRELNELPRLVRTSVKTLRAFDQRRLGMPDPVDVERTCLIIELLNAARLSSTELGVNETVLRVHGDMDTYLDHTTRILIEDAKNAMGAQRNTVRSFGDAAIRMTEILHGSQRAATIRRSLGVAAGSAEPGLRVAK